MARRIQTIADQDVLRLRLIELLSDLPERLAHGDVGEQVCELVQIHHHLRDLGASIGGALAPDDAGSGRARIIAYLRAQVGRIVHTDELMIVAAIGDYPRRIRELRAEHGWPIISGMAVRDLRQLDPRGAGSRAAPGSMAPDEYLLLEDRRDEGAPKRWETAGDLRASGTAATPLVRTYFEMFRGARITGEELRYLVGNKSVWTASTSELVAQGFHVSGADLKGPGLPAGIFVFSG